jgi:hypothetical protein
MPQLPTVTLPVIDDDMTIDAVRAQLRDTRRGGFVLGDPKGSRVVTASALGLIQKAGAFAGDTKIAVLRDRIIPTWTEPQSFWDRMRGRVTGRVTVGGVSVSRALAERPQEGYAILEMDRKNQLATVLADDPRQLEELQTPPV